MIERATIQHQTILSCHKLYRQHPSRCCFNNVMLSFVVLLYGFTCIERINGEFFPALEDLNVSLNEDYQSSIGDATDCNRSIDNPLSERSTTVVVNDTNILTATTTNMSDIEPPKSENDSFLQPDTRTMSYDYFTQHDDDYTYDDDITFVAYEDVTLGYSEDASIHQELQLKQSNTSDVESSVAVQNSDNDEVMNTIIDETTTQSSSEKAMINNHDTIVTDQKKQENTVSDKSLSLPENVDSSRLQKEEFLLETTTILDSLPGEHYSNDTTILNEIEELGNTLDSKDDTMVYGENNISDQSLVGTYSDENPMIDNGTISDNQNQTCYYYCSTVWGDRNVARRQPSTNVSILEQLFSGDVIELTDPTKLNATAHTNNVTQRDTTSNPANRRRQNQNHDQDNNDIHDARHEIQLPLQQLNLVDDDTLMEHDEETISKLDVDAPVLDDLENLFQNADISDEFDVSTKDSSIQEVLMGSATRIVFQRCKIAGRFIWNKARIVQKYIFHQVVKMTENNETFQVLSNRLHNLTNHKWLLSIKDGYFGIIRWMQNEDGEFSPLHKFRTAVGEWTIVQNLKNYDGEILVISQQQIQRGFEWIHRNAMNAFTHVDEFLDKMLSGSKEGVDDELDFKFLADKDFLKKTIVPDVKSSK